MLNWVVRVRVPLFLGSCWTGSLGLGFRCSWAHVELDRSGVLGLMLNWVVRVKVPVFLGSCWTGSLGLGFRCSWAHVELGRFALWVFVATKQLLGIWTLAVSNPFLMLQFTPTDNATIVWPRHDKAVPLLRMALHYFTALARRYHYYRGSIILY